VSGGDANQVQLGERTYNLKPQRIGRISRRLEQVFSLFGDLNTGSTPDEVGSGLYEVLKVFIPDLAPEWELAGYGSADDFEAKQRHDRELAEAREAYAEALLERSTEEAIENGSAWDELTDAQRSDFQGPAFEDPYDPEADRSPTPPEIMNAVETIWQIHGGDRFTRLLGKFLTPETVKRQVQRFLLESNLQRSQRLRQQSGESALTSSTPTSPTSTPGEAPPLSV
jgi:hypothetical protein